MQEVVINYMATTVILFTSRRLGHREGHEGFLFSLGTIIPLELP